MANDKTVSEEFAIDEGLNEFAEADELDALRAERDEMRDRFMRALADAENARKRGERDRREGRALHAQNLHARTAACQHEGDWVPTPVSRWLTLRGWASATESIHDKEDRQPHGFL